MNNETLAYIRKRLFFWLGFLLLVILALIMLRPFFTTIIISLISVILLKPLYNYFLGTKIVKKRKGLATTLTLLSGFLIVVIPLYIVVRASVTQLSGAVADVSTEEVEAFIGSVREFIEGTSTSIIPTEEVSGLIETVARFLISAGLGIAQWILEQFQAIPLLLVNVIIFLAIVAALLPLYDKLLELRVRTSPVGSELSELYNRKIVAMVKSLITGVFLIAIIQGLAMGIFYWLAGLDYVFLLILISALLAIIPMVGISWLVIVIAIFSFASGDTAQAIIVLFGFYGVVNWIDVLLRPRFISEDAHINTALFLLSMFAGLAWAGIMGLFYGPIIMLLLVTTVQIYIEEFAREDGEMIGAAVSSRTGRNDNSGSNVKSEVVASEALDELTEDATAEGVI